MLIVLLAVLMLRGRGRISFGHTSTDNEEAVRFSMVR